MIPHLTDKETEAEGLNNLPKAKLLLNEESGNPGSELVVFISLLD